MKKYTILLFSFFLFAACVDNELNVEPNDRNFPFRLILGADEGGDLPDAEDFDIEIGFADYIGTLPSEDVTIHYQFSDLESDMASVVRIDKVIYEVELDDCAYEREIEFTSSADGLSGTITVTADTDLGTLPESFEVVVLLPGQDETEGSFVFEITEVETSSNVIAGAPLKFEYEVLEGDLAGEWELELGSEEEFLAFQEVFGVLNPKIKELSFADVTGKVKAEFEFSELKLIIELVEEHDVTSCSDGEVETETENKEIEFEAEYEGEDGELTLEGSHFIVGDDGEVENEFDFIIEASYTINDDGSISIAFAKVVDEDSFADGEELFVSSDARSFTFTKD